MKYSFRSILVLALFFVATVGYSQSFSFRVLANKGDNTVTRNGNSEPLKTGASLFSTDVVTTAAGSYVGLMHKTGKTVELKTPGDHKVAELENKLNTTASSSASRYTDYIMAKLNEDEGGGNYRQNMAVTGAVERAASGSQIQVLLPSSIDVFNPEAIVRWREVEEANNYTVTLKNIFDEVVYTTETDKSMVKLDFNSEELANERLVILNVKVADNEEISSGDYGIKRMIGGDKESVATEVEALKTDLDDTTPLAKIIEASYYEENELLLDALTKYEEAIQLAPEVEDFQDLYEGFIVKYNLGN